MSYTISQFRIKCRDEGFFVLFSMDITKYIKWEFACFSSAGTLKTFLAGMIPDDEIEQIIEDYNYWRDKKRN